jgi:hypothetical protein
VWQSITVVFLSVLELVLIWAQVPCRDQLFCLAALLAALSPLAFLTAFLARRLFSGTLSDPNGIPPAHLRLFGTVRSADLNLAAVVAALIALLAILWIFRS